MTAPNLGTEQTTGQHSGMQTIFEECKRACASGTISPSTLCRQGGRLLKQFEAIPQSQRPTAAPLVHEFLELVRNPAVRRMSMDDDQVLSWTELVVRMIECSDLTVGRLFDRRAQQYGAKALFRTIHGDNVASVSWAETSARIEEIGRAFMALADGQPLVAIYGNNRLEVVLCDLACMAHGIVNTVIPANSLEDQVEHILSQTGANILVVGGTDPLRKSLAVWPNLPQLRRIVSLDETPTIREAGLMRLDRAVEAGQAVAPEALRQRANQARIGDLASTMFTSGTTGVPKGITFTQRNLVTKRFCRGIALPEVDEDDVLLCYLPLYHTFGRYLEMLGCIYWGATYCFAEDASTETLIHNMQLVHPTGLISVPKKWRDIYQRMTDSGAIRGDREAVAKALKKLTGGELCWGLSAAGRLDPAIFRFFQRHGVELLSGYGMTEATGGITMTPPGKYLEDSIGTPLPGIDIKLADDGELMLRGCYVTEGYTDPDDNAVAFQDGWLGTGDIVEQNNQGFLYIVDRKKDIYKNAAGRTVAPQRIEGLFADFPEIKRVFAVGDGREYMTLLVRPNDDCDDVDMASMSEKERTEYFRSLVVACNDFLATFERVVRFTLIDRDFSEELGELTAKGTFRRSVVEQHFHDKIESMYEHTYVEREVDRLRVRVPIGFLQQLGATETGTTAHDRGIELAAVGKRLRVCRDEENEHLVWVGNVCYEIERDVVDLDDWLRLPELWVGNNDLTFFTDERILLWSLSSHERTAQYRIVKYQPPSLPAEIWHERHEQNLSKPPSLLSIHAASVVLTAADGDAALRAAEYLGQAVRTGLLNHAILAEKRLQLAAMHHDPNLRRHAFLNLLEHQPVERFGESFEKFVASGQSFIDEEAVRHIARIGLSDEHWRIISVSLASLREAIQAKRTRQAEETIGALLGAIGQIGEARPEYYRRACRELCAWLIFETSPYLGDHIEKVLARLTRAFRARLEPLQKSAVDPDTNETYTWADTLEFEEGIEDADRRRITEAVTSTCMVREAVYNCHRYRLIDLEDVAPSSMWISAMGSRFGRTSYHVGLELRTGQRCDFVIVINRSLAEAEMLASVRMTSASSLQPGGEELVSALGGYWADHNLVTVEYVSGEPVEELVRHMHGHPDRDVRARIQDEWHHVCWAALAASYEFYLRTGRQWMLTASLGKRVTVPMEDYDPLTRMISIIGHQPFTSPLDMLGKLNHDFLRRMSFQFPKLRDLTPVEVLFDATLESLGREEGLEFLRTALEETASAKESALQGPLQSYVEKIERQGYVPRAVHFAVKRYRSWHESVPTATVHARAGEIKHLQIIYDIEKAEQRFPGARLRLFAETVLKNSPANVRKAIDRACEMLRREQDHHAVLGRLYHELEQEPLDHDVKYFLTRAAYPHLEVDEKAELVTVPKKGTGYTELVTHHTGRDGIGLIVRAPTNTRQVDEIHRIFYQVHIGGGVTSHDRYLLIFDESDNILGGLCYVWRTPRSVFLDKIAIQEWSRGRGIGQAVMSEFIRRMRAAGAATISARFIRREFIERCGFRPHPRYPGLTLLLDEPVACKK